ncbi:hypothetical protein CONCODRAFT_2187 [Conidiobolus coronatus NRRL 28638]|uniref:Uncharacterized protein n=1 Tax=Conidiobolus coronatus (strain ATCC 28846 / CBS 209.66 / NRRL 28638) TaxID=796925 RepID=A0A137PI08_CONC2|nr:hypothetical protein CONCODRAFT_2187 [Conidiobolus coronatus NRRL 28638]|eukprot:KXN74633.1 hypothetical protein CONCODRAFT_2187 [Conidiobolus coronatus NRRL 28638]
MELNLPFDTVPLLIKSCSDELIKVARFKILLNNLKDENFGLLLNEVNSPISLVQNINENTDIEASTTNNTRSSNLMNRLNLAHKPKVRPILQSQLDCPIALKESLNQLELDFKNYLNQLIIPITTQLKPIILNQLPQLKHLINTYLLNPPFPDELLNHLTQYPPLTIANFTPARLQFLHQCLKKFQLPP